MKITIKNKQNQNLIGIFHKANNKKELVIICHGFGGNKDRGLIKNLALSLKKANINSFRFDFSGNNESEGKFINSTTTKQLSDLNAILNHFKSYKTGLIGHSKGGMISVLTASKNKNIKFLIPIAASLCTKYFKKQLFPGQKEKIEKGETIYWWQDKFNKKFPITPEAVKDLEKYNPLEEAKNITCPILIIHGSKDMTVNVEVSEELYKKIRSKKQIKIIENATHNFKNIEHLKQTTKCIINWIKSL